jgi:hypothetical protein
MSIYSINVPAPDDHDYHAARHEERRRRALQSLDPGAILSVIDATIASESDPTKHPLHPFVVWHLEKCLTPIDGGQFFDTFRRLVIDAINVCLDEQLAQGED